MADSRLANQTAQDMNNAAVDRHDQGTTNAQGKIEIRTGTAPTDVDAPVTGTLLATLPLSNPAFGNAVDQNPGSRATANAITPDTAADATGIAGYYRSYDRDDGAVLQGDVSDTGGSGNLKLNNTSVQAGVEVQVASWDVDQPEAS